MKDNLIKIGFDFSKNQQQKDIRNGDVWKNGKVIIVATTYLKYSDVHLEYVDEQLQNGDIGIEALNESKKDFNLITEIRNLEFQYEGKVEDKNNILLFEKENIIETGSHTNQNILGCFICK